jgi:hypothetical protein
LPLGAYPSSVQMANLGWNRVRSLLDEEETIRNAGVAERLRQLVSQNAGICSYSEKEPTLQEVFMLVTQGLVR